MILFKQMYIFMVLSWSWSYGSWIYNYLCSQCLSLLTLWVRIPLKARCTTLCDKVCQWLASGRWFSPGAPVSSTNKTDCHDITEILLKVALNTIKQTNNIHFHNPVLSSFTTFHQIYNRFGFMVFNATFNNISVISWR